MNETEKRIIQLIDEHREELIAMGNELYTRAERGFAEVNTSAFIADKLKKLGLNVQTGLAGTGLRASAGKEGGVNVALISELDGILCPSHLHSKKRSSHPTSLSVVSIYQGKECILQIIRRVAL